jgi:molecular chaperone DnaK
LGENFDATEKAGIESAIADVEALLKDDSATKEQIEEKVKVLTEKSHKFAEAVYAKEQGGEKEQAAKKADDDDIIDAEVE